MKHPLVTALALTLLAVPSSPLLAKHDSEHLLSEEDWQEVMNKVELLESSALIPSLLPIIMINRDALQLTGPQLARLYEWRKTHYTTMVRLMDHIIGLKVQFGIESLSPEIDEEHLIQLQHEIQALQRELLAIRLSCRRIVVETFTPEQWENLEFLAADNPRLASLLSQATAITPLHSH